MDRLDWEVRDLLDAVGLSALKHSWREYEEAAVEGARAEDSPERVCRHFKPGETYVLQQTL